MMKFIVIDLRDEKNKINFSDEIKHDINLIEDDMLSVFAGVPNPNDEFSRVIPLREKDFIVVCEGDSITLIKELEGHEFIGVKKYDLKVISPEVVNECFGNIIKTIKAYEE